MRGVWSVGRSVLLGGSLLLGLVACQHMMAHESSGGTAAGSMQGAVGNSPELMRGRYLVMNVASCSSCHNMTMPTGEPAQARARGVEPNLARLNASLLAEAGRIIESGRGSPIGMPVYKMNHEDAAAVMAYLKALADHAAPPANGGGNAPPQSGGPRVGQRGGERGGL